MTPAFENFNKITADDSTPESGPDTGSLNSQEAMEQAEDTVVELVKDVAEAAAEELKEDPTVHFKGRDWQLSKLPEEYAEIAYTQKELNRIQEVLSEIVQENQESEPTSDGEATSYFKIQLLARVQGFLESRSETQAEELGLQLQHPDIHQALQAKEGEDFSDLKQAA